MAPGSVDPSFPPPILVLGVGNTLLSDDGLGPTLLEQIAEESERWNGEVEFLDGGTQGLALLGHLSGRKAVIILDALALGSAPGTVSVLRASELLQLGAQHASTSHEGNAGELLAVATLLGELPEQVFVIGIEPQTLVTAIGLSEPVQQALPAAARRVVSLLARLCSPYERFAHA
jgi:hydrogenase maturation protease